MIDFQQVSLWPLLYASVFSYVAIVLVEVFMRSETADKIANSVICESEQCGGIRPYVLGLYVRACVRGLGGRIHRLAYRRLPAF